MMVLFFFTLVLGLPLCWGVQTNITLPTKDGVDVAVLVFPGAYLKVDQYEQLGLDLQEMSNLRIWLTFSGDFPGDLINPFAMIEGFEQALSLLEENGFPSGSPVFAAGHSLAGTFIYDVAVDFPEVTGVIMWAAYFVGSDIADYPLIALTLSGDIDGQTQIPIIATSFQQLENLASEDPERIYNTPVILLQDINHGIYATGELPSRVAREDIPSPLSGDEGRVLIAETTDAFLQAHVLEDEDREAARAFLSEGHLTTKEIVEPILNMRVVEQNGDTSPWVRNAQIIISSVNTSQITDIQVDNVLVDSEDAFVGTRATREVQDATLLVNTSAYFTLQDMGAKMNSRDGLHDEAQNNQLDIQFGDFVPCSDVNQAAFDWAYRFSSDIARQRFDEKGITINIPDDLEADTGMAFVESRLDFSYNSETLEATVQSTRIVVDADGVFLPGVHYCRLWSPLQAIQFIYVDALKNQTVRYV